MKTTDMNRLLVEATVQRTLERLTEAPEREIRNLIDMGLEFSEGRFQKQIFATAQTMLQNPNSAYYTLVKHAANHIDHERLLNFGMNLGYESCTKGAGTIRAIEAQEGFNIPWALTLSLNSHITLDVYDRIFEQSTALGIYTTLLYVNDDFFEIFPLIKKHSHMAFVLFVNGNALSDACLQTLHELKNILICIADDDSAPEACKKLYDAHMLYGIYHLYNERNYQQINSEAWLDTLLPHHPSLVMSINEDHCPLRISSAVFEFIRQERESQRYPFILMDLQHDLQLIDQIISDDLCMVGFDKGGALHTLDGRSDNPMHNIFEHPLKEILKDALKK
ncbi:MAG: hypothetical protein U0N74_02885 [Peptococcaceae bacterium]|jgi:hypothetical protein|nr:hypothetical protein [Peptococcaceae bacterium]